MRRSYRWLLGVMVCAMTCLALPAKAQNYSERTRVGKAAVTMQALLQEGVQAFQQGDYKKAAESFTRLEADFGKEPQYKPLPRTLLPIWAYAEARSDNPDKAIELFERFLKEYPDATSQQAFVLYSLAQAHQAADDPRKAIDAYQRFIEISPDSPEAVLSAMRQSDLYFEMGENEEGIKRLVGFSNSEKVPSSLQAQARLRAIQKAQELGRMEQSAELLLTRQWDIQSMPELAVLAFSALKAGDALMKLEDREADAVRLYRLVPPKWQLVNVQRQKLQSLKNAYADKQRDASAGLQGDAIWSDYFRNLITQVQGGLDTLEQTEDYTPGMQMRLGQAFLLLGRNREAYVLYETLAENPDLDKDFRSAAHYRWILSANALEQWDDSLRIARSFLERYPGNPLAPEALYLIANAYHEQMRYADAIPVLDDLLANYPDHRLASRWLFTRGFNKALNQENAAAREDFEAYLARYPDGQQLNDARLWFALTWFFEKHYEEAMAAFDAALTQVPKSDYVYPELVYRRASTLYSMRDYDAALVAIDDFLAKYPKDQRAPEARVLRGDILMGQGDLLAASTAFAQVTPEAGPLYAYAIFQRAKIFRALEEYDLMISHFQAYLDNEDVPEKIRLAEALYWIGWAYQQKGETAQAFPIFMDALVRYGDDPEAGETDGILQALQKLHTQYRRGEAPLEASSALAGELLTAEDFTDFLAAQREQALKKKELTWYSRVSLYLAGLEEKRKNHDRAEAYRWETIEKVPEDKLDAQGLAELGLLLQNGGFESARDYFDRLLEEYPGRFHTGAAYYGMARIALAEGDLVGARAWLQQFKAEAPLHPLSTEVTLLYADVLIQSGQTEQAVEALEDLLRLKTARGRPHAQALAGIARAYETSREPRKAIAYYQRIYTVYRAYPDLLAPAYLRSATLFEEIGDQRAAFNTYQEMLKDERLKEFEAYAVAQKEAARLEAILPPEPESVPPEPEPETAANPVEEEGAI